MSHNFIKIVFLTLFCSSFIFAQTTDEEELRIKFVKNLTKQRSSDSEQEPASAYNNQKIEIATENNGEETIKIETNLIRLDVLVYDDKGRVILGLKPEDFTVTENNILQEIGTFSLGDSQEVPRTIVLILDYSGSQYPYIKTSVNSAKLLVDKLNPQDRLAIVTDDVELLVDFTNDKEKLKSSLDALRKKADKGDVGKSFQMSALYVAIREMFDNKDIRPIIIFQTDGDQLTGLRRVNAPLNINIPRATSFTDREMLSTIERSRVTVYSVISGSYLLGLVPDEQEKKVLPYLEKVFSKGIGKDPEELSKQTQILYRQQSAMVNIAKVSGGLTESLEGPEQADAVYENILNGIKNRYLLGYYPTNQERDGKRRNVKVEVKNHPEYIVLGRKFYFAPPPKK